MRILASKSKPLVERNLLNFVKQDREIMFRVNHKGDWLIELKFAHARPVIPNVVQVDHRWSTWNF